MRQYVRCSAKLGTQEVLSKHHLLDNIQLEGVSEPHYSKRDLQSISSHTRELAGMQKAQDPLQVYLIGI